MQTLRLHAHQDKRLKQGHAWIYSNEIQTSLKSFVPGELVFVESNKGERLGIAYINPHCLLCARLLTRDPQVSIDVDFFARRILQAKILRERFYSQPFYRLIFGESDALPGLVVDQYQETLVVQVNTAGMEQLTPLILAALQKVIVPTRIILRNDSPYRAIEQLPLLTRIEKGDDSPLIVQENGFTFVLPLLDGQKTGWFYDHRDNREQWLPYVADKTVLDVFCYLGGWSLPAARIAKHVTAIDSSQKALDILQANARTAAVEKKITTVCADAFTALQALVDQGQHYDAIVIDPPALIKNKKDKPQGMQAYVKLCKLALTLLNENGLLVFASCSMHLSREDLLEVLQKSYAKQNVPLSILAQWSQSKDHPIHPAIPETQYLKALFCMKR